MKQSPITIRIFCTCAMLLLCCAAFLNATPAQTTPPDSQATVQLWVQRLTATMEEHAGPADVERLLALYAADAVYEHPHAGARIEGKALMRKGMSSHLGETRAPKIQITQTLSGDGFAVVEMTVKLELRQDDKWVPLERRQVVVLELKDSRIQRIIDHWDRLAR